MNTHRLTRAALIGLFLMGPVTVAAADAPHAYLSELTPAVDGDTLALRLWVRGEAGNSVILRPDGVQVTLEGAYLDPAKQHLAVDHPAVREVFAYQYDPDTVRVRVLTEGLPPGALRDHVTLKDEGRSLVLTISGLEGAAKPAPVPVPAATTRPAPEPSAKAAPPEAPEPKAAAEPETSRPASARAAEARAEALATLERLLGDGEPKAEETPADGAGMQALRVPREALLPESPESPGGGGAPAEAGKPPVTAEAAPDTKPSPVAPKPVPAPVAKAHPVKTAPAKAPETSASGAGTEAPVPLKPLPHGATAARPDLWSSGLRMAGGLLLVLGLLAAGVAVLRRVRGATLGGRTPIRVLASASLGSRQNIVVVEVEGRRLVVGVTPGGMELLADLSASGGPGRDTSQETADSAADGPDPKPGTGADSPFARALARAGDRDAADALRRTTRDLQRRVRRLKARSA
jgi:flagellar protein FliO/FliZ